MKLSRLILAAAVTCMAFTGIAKADWTITTPSPACHFEYNWADPGGFESAKADCKACLENAACPFVTACAAQGGTIEMGGMAPFMCYHNPPYMSSTGSFDGYNVITCKGVTETAPPTPPLIPHCVTVD